MSDLLIIILQFGSRTENWQKPVPKEDGTCVRFEGYCVMAQVLEKVVDR
ncbi:MAG: hypothetical protein IJW05_13175 [Lentisphaeria bacterium]|nr:hypothetical protein [Lentisphaeria bacterium]